MSKEWGRAALLLGIGGIVGWRALTPEAKQRVWQFLDDLADDDAQARQRQQQRAQQELAGSLDSSLDPWVSILLGGSLAPGGIPDRRPPSVPPDSVPHEIGQSQTDPVQRAVSLTEPDARWSEALLHPAVVLTLGKRESGKSAPAYRPLELFRYRLMPYVVGVPDQSPTTPETQGAAGRACLGGQRTRLTCQFESHKVELGA